MRKKQFTTFVAILMSVILSACVTQDFENGETPVVKNQANRNDMAATRISLGLGYLKMGNMPQAKQNLERAKNFAPDMVQVYTAFAHYYETVAEPELTVKSYEKALSLKSDDADTLNNYGVYLCRQNQIAAAEQQFLKAIAVPSYILVAKSYENLSSCFLQKDNFVKAETYLRKAIAHSPSSASTLYQMVRLQYAMGDYKQAKSFEQRFEKVTRRFTPQSLALACKVYTKLGQRRTAKNYATMLVKMYPQSWEAQQYLLNELELIEPDNLAKKYQLTQVSKESAKPKKRIIKLSPKKISPNKVTPKLESQVQKSAVITATAATQTVLSEVSPTLTASPDAINAALISTVVDVNKANTKGSASTEVLTNTKTEKKLSPKSTQDLAEEKQVVVMSAPKVAPTESMITENVVTSEKISSGDAEVFHVAKKPVAIVEDPVEELVNIKVVGKTELKPIKKGTKSVAKETKPTIKEPLEQKKIKNLPDFHIVESGDTLYNISVQYNIKIKALRKWNHISKNKKLHIKDIIFLENPKLVNK